MKLPELLGINRSNHYKMLVVIDNSKSPQSLIKALEDIGWKAFNVNRAVLRLMGDVPPEKLKLRIADNIKKWAIGLPDKVIFYNVNILYSPDLGKLTPIGAFKYRSRDKEMVLIMEGQLIGNRLVYSEPGRADYTEMDVGGLICVLMGDINV